MLKLYAKQRGTIGTEAATVGLLYRALINTEYAVTPYTNSNKQ